MLHLHDTETYMKHTLLFVALIGSTYCVHAQRPQYPVTPKVSHVDVYHSIEIPDPYRWLEASDSSAVKQWVEAQNAVTFDFLGRIPFRDKVRERLTKIWNYPKYTAPFREGKRWFYFKNDGLQNQSVMYVQNAITGPASVFLDPNTFSADGTIALADVSFSKDGRYCAYAVTKSGSDWRDIYVMDVASRTHTVDTVSWAKFTDIAWFGNGFYYSRYDKPAEGGKALTASNEGHKVYFHTVGTGQAEDKLIYEEKDHPKRNFGVGVTEDERFAILSGFEGGSKGNPIYVKDPRKPGGFAAIVESYDDEFNVITNIGDRLIVLTNRKAPRYRVIEINVRRPEEANWKEVIPEKSEVLSSVSAIGGKLVTVYMKDASHRAYVYNESGKREREVSLGGYGTVSLASGKREDREVFYSFTSFTSPTNIYRLDLRTGASKLFRRSEIDFAFDDYVTEQVFATSNDGTRVPMFIVHRKGIAYDGSNPTLLYGYGGFNISMLPSFSVSRLMWLENGGIYAMANIRGGGEYGEEWHEAGTKLKKQNVFDDFISAAEYLASKKYTSPAKLAVQGGSNGGLLVGAVINKRPDLFRVALPAVGVMDMLRFHKFTIGWAWTRDYGSSDDSVQFRYLLGYSPLHNIREQEYPAVLVTTADHDDRVVPAHSFKYIATLQEKQRGANPVLIRIETKAGHGGGKPTAKIIEETADIYSFMFHEMGVSPKY